MARPYPRPVVVQRPVDRVVVRFLVAAVIASGAMANLAAAERNVARGNERSLGAQSCSDRHKNVRPQFFTSQVSLLLFVKLAVPALPSRPT